MDNSAPNIINQHANQSQAVFAAQKRAAWREIQKLQRLEREIVSLEAMQ